MKKLAAFFATALIIFAGCKKTGTGVSTGETNQLQEKIMVFIKGRIAKSNGSLSVNIRDIQDKINFDQLRMETFSEDVMVITAPVTDINVHDFVSFSRINAKVSTNSVKETRPGKQEITKVFFVVKNDEILDGTVVAISSDNYSHEDLDRNFISIIQNKVPDFTGHINVNSLDKRPYNNWGLRKGRVESSTVLKRGGIPQGTANVRLNQTCTDWYWVTTYHYLDGSQTQTSEYVGTTCLGDEENFPPNQDGGGVPLDSICAQTKRLINDVGFTNAMTDLKNRLSDPVENGYVQKKNAFGGFAYTFKPGTSAGASPAGSVGPIDGFFHTHTTGLLLTFSLIDIQQMYEALVKPGHVANLATFTLGVVLPNQQIQLVRISDPAAFITFGDANLLSSNFASFNNWAISNHFAGTVTYEEKTAALLKSLQGSGLTLYEGNANALGQGFARLDPSSDPLIKFIKTKCNL